MREDGETFWPNAVRFLELLIGAYLVFAVAQQKSIIDMSVPVVLPAFVLPGLWLLVSRAAPKISRASYFLVLEIELLVGTISLGTTGGTLNAGWLLILVVAVCAAFSAFTIYRLLRTEATTESAS